MSLYLTASSFSASVLHGSLPQSASSSQHLRSQIELVAHLLNELAVHRQSGLRGDQLAVADSLTALGRLIYTQVIPPGIQRALQSLPLASPLVVASNDPLLPWELAHDGQEFFAFKHAISRQIMARQLPRPSKRHRAGVGRRC